MRSNHGGFCLGEGENERASCVQLAFGADGATLRLHHILGNCEAKTGASGLSGTGFVDPIEAFEDAVEVLGSNSLTKVADAELDGIDRFRDLAGADDHPAMESVAGSAVFDGVLDEIAENLKDGVGVGEDLGIGEFADLKDGVFVLDEPAHSLNGIAYQQVCGDWGGVEFLLGGFYARHDEKVFGEAVHAGGVLEDGGQKLAGLRA